MTDTITTSKNLTLPTPGQDTGSWGAILNNDLNLVDIALGGTLSITLTSGTLNLTATQAQNTGYIFLGAIFIGVVITWPPFSGFLAIENQSNSTIFCGISGTTVTIPPGSNVGVWSDGTNFSALTPPIGEMPGTNSNGNASSGNVGEFIHTQVVAASPVSMTTTTLTEIMSLSLSPGDWDVSGSCAFVASGACTVCYAGFNSTGTTPDLSLRFEVDTSATIGITFSSAVPPQRFSLAATTTIYLIGQANFTSGAVTACGNMNARRVR